MIYTLYVPYFREFAMQPLAYCSTNYHADFLQVEKTWVPQRMCMFSPLILLQFFNRMQLQQAPAIYV